MALQYIQKLGEPDEAYRCSLDEPTVKKALEELNENPVERLNAVKQFRGWIVSQPHLICRTEFRFLLMILRSAKFSQLRAREILENQLSLRNKIPEWFVNIDTRDVVMQELLDTGFNIPLPKRDRNGCKILYQRPGVLDVNNKNLTSAVEIKSHLITGTFVNSDEETQVNGCVFLVDHAGMTAKQITRWKLEDIKKWFQVWQKNVPGRLKAMHHINAGAVFEAMMAMIKPFLTKKYHDRFHFHKTMESLYKHIPEDLLPSELLPDDYDGPHQGPLEDIAKSFKNAVSDDIFRNYLLEVTSPKYCIVETKRPKDKFPQEAFRKLNVD